jgi:hypothetical protein
MPQYRDSMTLSFVTFRKPAERTLAKAQAVKAVTNLHVPYRTGNYFE